jgi:hypothetical protein
MTAQKLHPDISEYRIILLNEWSHSMILERTFDDESNVQVNISVRHSGWVEDIDGKNVLLPETETPVWVMESRERCDDLIRLLETIRDDAFPK